MAAGDGVGGAVWRFGASLFDRVAQKSALQDLLLTGSSAR
ncbi:hypothetical protein WH5701_04085 [Synechococcus sp. WH 5701]|nr:hypothetical protein WH5701_04085 [Synechococcus sp. WH 5701]